MMAGDHFNPLTATETQARALTLQQGFDAMTVALVRGRDSRLVFQLLPPYAPLRRWCAAGQLLKLRGQGLCGASPAQLQLALQLCAEHDLVPRRSLLLAAVARLGAAPEVPRAAKRGRKARRPANPTHTARQQRKVWELVRRYKWACPGQPLDKLWRAVNAAGQLGPGLEPGIDGAVRRLGLGSSQARARLNEAITLYGEPTWPARAAPPMTF